MNSIKPRQIELAQSVPAIVGILPSSRQNFVLSVGRQAAAVIAQAVLTIREQQAAMAVADLYLQFCQEDEANQKWSELMDAAYQREESKQ